MVHGEIARQFSELGVILLMFGVGLKFDIHELLAVRKVVAPGALVQILISTGCGVALVHQVGWPLGAAVVFGLAISVASTVVATRMLSDSDALQTPGGRAAIGWLVLEDLFTVLVLVLLPIVAGHNSEARLGGTLVAIALALLKVAALVGFTLLGGGWLIPVILRFVSRLGSRELFSLTVLALALGIAIGSVTLFGVSMALGAFLAGMVVGQSEFGGRAASDALPMRDAFAVLFFVSMGMLLDPAKLLGNGWLILGSLAIILIVTPLVTFGITRLLGGPRRTGLTLAVSLAQIGEFSFILATMGRQLGLLPEPATQVLVAASILSITVNPLMFGLLKSDASSKEGSPSDTAHHAIVVGYGPVGRSLAGMLRENAIEPTIIEMNEDVVKRLNAEGWHAVSGDASERDVLFRAGVLTASDLIFSASGSPGPVIRTAKAMNPKLPVLTRTARMSDVVAMKGAGANGVVIAEREVALAMVERVLQGLGGTADQLDRARDRVRQNLDWGRDGRSS
jgi:CPA2 family monovalent cation:H+ antiporter-2